MESFLHSHLLRLLTGGGGGGGIPSSTWCDVTVSLWGDLRVHGPMVIPLCLVAVAVGFMGWRRIRSSQLTGRAFGVAALAALLFLLGSVLSAL